MSLSVTNRTFTPQEAPMRRTHKNPMENNAFEGARMRFGRKTLNFTVLDDFFAPGYEFGAKSAFLAPNCKKLHPKTLPKPGYSLLFSHRAAEVRKWTQKCALAPGNHFLSPQDAKKLIFIDFCGRGRHKAACYWCFPVATAMFLKLRGSQLF